MSWALISCLHYYYWEEKQFFSKPGWRKYSSRDLTLYLCFPGWKRRLLEQRHPVLGWERDAGDRDEAGRVKILLLREDAVSEADHERWGHIGDHLWDVAKRALCHYTTCDLTVGTRSPCRSPQRRLLIRCGKVESLQKYSAWSCSRSLSVSPVSLTHIFWSAATRFHWQMHYCVKCNVDNC